MASTAETPTLKWEGKRSVKIKTFTADQIWPLLSDEFCSIHKWLPSVDSCHRVDGTPGQPGLTRHCVKVNSGISLWVNEKLLTIDNDEKRYSYEVLDNNVGFHNYVATIQVSPLVGGGCEIEWSFVSDPADGWKLEDLYSYIDSSLHAMAENMETALRS